MLDHVGLEVSDYHAARRSTKRRWRRSGSQLLMEFQPASAGSAARPSTGRSPTSGSRPAAARSVSGAHIAFTARDHETVDSFHAAALAAGGTDNGAPGPRPIYHPSYYGAFVLDPDGNNVEAVCHRG